MVETLPLEALPKTYTQYVVNALVITAVLHISALALTGKYSAAFKLAATVSLIGLMLVGLRVGLSWLDPAAFPKRPLPHPTPSPTTPTTPNPRPRPEPAPRRPSASKTSQPTPASTPAPAPTEVLLPSCVTPTPPTVTNEPPAPQAAEPSPTPMSSPATPSEKVRRKSVKDDGAEELDLRKGKGEP